MKTPKTEKSKYQDAHGMDCVSADFARQLEVQVQELREALALLIVATDHKCGVAEQANHARTVLERTQVLLDTQ